MESHLFGQDQIFEDGQGDPAPTSGTSLAVRQFMAFVWGTWKPHAPHQPWPVVMVKIEVMYCMQCKAVHNFDAVLGLDRKVVICRCCGMEVML